MRLALEYGIDAVAGVISGCAGECCAPAAHMAAIEDGTDFFQVNGERDRLVT